ncbi:MAG TPA: FeS-binding protein [Candidatus Kapabacteria bacterium]|nr:FeS-binding protein [Candidatus Kapabacteria bacterium]HPO62378.1 FeS-binding protein [Candidatus Kapabacteria bacterium]
MKLKLFKREHTFTDFIQLDTKKCKACWRCLDDCPKEVIGKVDLPWHKHALIVKLVACSGCFTCIDSCKNEALSIKSKDIK